MKKLIIASVCSLAVVGAAFGQGAVNWGSISFANFTAQTNTVTYSSFTGGGSTAGGATGVAAVGATQGAASLGSGYFYALLVGAVWNGSAATVPSTSFAQFSSWTDSGLAASNNVFSAGRVGVENPNTAATVNAMSSSVSNSIVLVGWSANLGSTWSTALGNMEAGTWSGNAFFGVSNEGFIEAATLPASQGNSVFGSAAQTYGTPIQSLNTQLFLLSPVPEPGTIALAALGGASLLLFRRKK